MIHKYSSKKTLLAEIEQLNNKISQIEKQNQAILNNSPACTKIIDLDYNLQYMSASGINALDIDDITKFYNKPYPLEFYPSSFKSDMAASLKQCKETNKTVIHEAPITNRLGNTLWFHSSIVPISDDSGNIEYFLVVSSDITEFKKPSETS
tara:strand:+ start:1383 stop:1835 length:453 start_codon:yes stop_codon:yes gene_type:complete